MMSSVEFLKNFKDFMIQTFDDREYVAEKDKSLITAGAPSQYSWDRLYDLNKRGAGIFFTVNQFPLGKRGKDFCAGVNAWYVECDSLSIEQQMEMYLKPPLMPTFLVLSKKSIHAYWLAVDGTEKNFIRIQMGLQKKFQGDPAMKDIARVLRIPGFTHNKTENPFLVEIIHAEPSLRYTEKQMMEKFPFEVSDLPKQNFDLKTPLNSTPNDWWAAISSLDNKTVLERLSGQGIANGENYSFSKRPGGGLYIIVNGKTANAWIDAAGKIGSGNGGGPTWIQWLEYFGRSKADIAKWAKENLVDLLPVELLSKIFQPMGEVTNLKSFGQAPKIVSKIEVPQKSSLHATNAMEHLAEIEAIFATPPSPYTWGTSLLDKKLPAVEDGHYVILFGQQASGKTLASLYMARENAKKVNNVVFLTLEMSKAQLLKRYIRDRAGVTKEEYRFRDFDFEIAKKYLPELGALSFMGIDNGERYYVDDIERVIVETKAKMLFIDNLNKIAGQGKNEFEITQSVSHGILNLTRKYKVPIILIHHANKQMAEKPYKRKEGDNEILTPEKAIKFRGIAGMRGTNKTADDADIILEVARYSEEFKNEFLTDNVKTCTGVSVYKDREFDARGVGYIYYYKGDFYDMFPKQLILADKFKNNEIDKLAKDFGGDVE